MNWNGQFVGTHSDCMEAGDIGKSLLTSFSVLCLYIYQITHSTMEILRTDVEAFPSRKLYRCVDSLVVDSRGLSFLTTLLFHEARSFKHDLRPPGWQFLRRLEVRESSQMKGMVVANASIDWDASSNYSER